MTPSLSGEPSSPSISWSSNRQAGHYVPNRLNQYASVAGTGFTHDANGNLSSDGAYSYEYDEENRLRSAVGGGFTTSYEYDPLGRRRAKTVNGTLTKFVSDNAEEVEERDGANTVLRRYVYGSGIDERIALLDAACAGGRCYYLTNWQGSTTTLVNQTSSTLNATYHYGPYGEGTNWNPSDALTGNPFRYTGRRVDPETGLYYYRARYYSPRLGRFMQTDPIGTKDDLNLYAYALADPLGKTDPSGEFAFVTPLIIACAESPPCVLMAMSIAAVIGQRLAEPDRAESSESDSEAPEIPASGLPDAEAEVTGGASPDRVTSKGTKIYGESPTGESAEDTMKGVRELPGATTEKKPGQRGEVEVVTLPDGSKVIDRPSKDGPRTIEIQNPNGKTTTEVRYPPPPPPPERWR